MSRVLSLVLLCLALLRLPAATGGPKSPRVFDHRLLLPAGNSDRTPAERAATAVACLRQEVRLPSEGRGTEADTRHYLVLQWMLLYLGHHRVRDGLDPAVIWRAARQAPPGEERDVLILLLGQIGEQEAAGEVAAFLADSRRPASLRVVAAAALGYLRHPGTIDILVRVMETDPAWREAINHSSSKKRMTHKSYLVRSAAQQALRAFARDNLLPEAVRKRVEAAHVAEELTEEEYRALREREQRRGLEEQERLLREAFPR